jgi:gas vesicle protein
VNAVFFVKMLLLFTTTFYLHKKGILTFESESFIIGKKPRRGVFLKQEKLEKKIVKSYENEHFYDQFEDMIEQVQAWFITGGFVSIGVSLLFSLPTVILLTSMASIFAPMILLTFSRAMKQFYKDHSDSLKQKLEKLREEYSKTTTKTTKLEDNLEQNESKDSSKTKRTKKQPIKRTQKTNEDELER